MHSHLRSPRVAVLGLALTLILAACSSDGSDDAQDDVPASSSTTAATPDDGITTTTTIERPVLPDGRPIDVQVPPGYDPEEPAPLLLLLHGFGANGFVQDGYLQLAQVAADRGMLYVFPSGTENQMGRRFWNATEACCARDGEEAEVDDVGYLMDVIDTVKADYAVDPDQVFLMGHSNGGFMSFRMACENADVIAAIATLAAATFADPDDCAPTEPVASLQVHGTGDETIRYEGGEIFGNPYPGALETLEMWATYNGCDLTPDNPAPEPRTIIRDSEPAPVIAHSDCDPGGHAELWTAPGGVHIPAITPDFSAQVVDFLLAHPKP